MTRKVLRFGPSIATIKTVISNINDLIEYRTTEPEHIVILKTLSAFFLGMFFICDHYLWLYKVTISQIQVGLVSNSNLNTKFTYYSALGWLLDCFTCIIKNIALWKEMVFNQLCRNPKRGRLNKFLQQSIWLEFCAIPLLRIHLSNLDQSMAKQLDFQEP